MDDDVLRAMYDCGLAIGHVSWGRACIGQIEHQRHGVWGCCIFWDHVRNRCVEYDSLSTLA
jgi:hypothetical protein